MGGVGSRERIDVPVYAADEEEQVTAKTILSAEDNAANRKIIRDLLTKKGYRVIEALNGEEAVALARKEVPDLILMDIQLPKMSGYDAATAIKSDPALESIPIIAVTSYAFSGDEKKAYESGCDDYVAKPFKPKLLLEKVERYLVDADG
jgi:two-component system cell cycle response regulator DivK